MLYQNNPFDNNGTYSPFCFSCPLINKCSYMRSDYGLKKTLLSVKLGEQILSPNNFKIAYPFLPDSEDNQARKRINDGITTEVSELFKIQILQPEAIDFKDITASYETMLNQSRLLSILFELYEYVDGAAHGYTLYSSITAATNTGTIYSFSNLFNGSINYVSYLNELAKQYIKDNDITLINEYNGITPNQKFYLTPDNLVLYYQVYDYTPYAYGLLKIPIPYSKIQNLLSKNSPIKRLIE